MGRTRQSTHLKALFTYLQVSAAVAPLELTITHKCGWYWKRVLQGLLARISHKLPAARPFKRRPIRPRGLKGAAGILDSMSKSLEGARPYRVDG